MHFEHTDKTSLGSLEIIKYVKSTGQFSKTCWPVCFTAKATCVETVRLWGMRARPRKSALFAYYVRHHSVCLTLSQLSRRRIFGSNRSSQQLSFRGQKRRANFNTHHVSRNESGDLWSQRGLDHQWGLLWKRTGYDRWWSGTGFPAFANHPKAAIVDNHFGGQIAKSLHKPRCSHFSHWRRSGTKNLFKNQVLHQFMGVTHEHTEVQKWDKTWMSCLNGRKIAILAHFQVAFIS